MAILPIIHYPDEVLEKECEPVDVFDKRLGKLLDNMYDTMVAEDGVGLAAPQIGIAKMIAVVDIEDEHGRIELINPKILAKKGSQTDIEGCLSFPGLYGKVERPFSVRVEAQDRHGGKFTIDAEDFLARALQHEIDHLHGVLFTSKVLEYVELEEDGSDEQ